MALPLLAHHAPRDAAKNAAAEKANEPKRKYRISAETERGVIDAIAPMPVG